MAPSLRPQTLGAFASLALTRDGRRLIDLARLEKATLDKEWTRKGKYINTRLVPMSLNAHKTSLMLTEST